MPPIHLEAFVQAAASGQYVDIRVGSEGPAVIAVGAAPDGRRVAWIDPTRPGGSSAAALGVVAAFIAALEESYGPGICGMVSRELALSEVGRPLPSPLVRRAVEMAAASRQLYAGHNFATRLMLSARRGGAEYDAVCARMGLSPDALDSAGRARADELFERAFAQASHDDTVCVDTALARRLFAEAVRAAIDQSGPKAGC